MLKRDHNPVAGPGPGTMLARLLLPVVLIAPLVIGALHLLTERAEWFSPGVVTGLTVAANAVVLLWVMWLIARSANLADQRRRRADAALQERREWLRVTLTSIGDAVLATDPQGRVTFLNPVAAALTGWSEEQALGRPLGEVFRIIDEETREPAEDIAGRVLREGRAVILANHTALVARDGREIPIEDSAAPIRDSAGSIAGVVLVFHDVTEKRRAQQALRESEQRVRLKLDSILSPEGDIGKLELGDILDVPAVRSLMEDFYKLAGIPMAIIDLKGKVLAGAGWQPICIRFHRVHPETCRHCIESDTQLTAGIAPGEFRLYKCKNGMWDVATPILIGGEHFGNLFSGQFFFADETPDHDLFRAQARRYGFDEAEYLAALDAVPRLSREVVQTGLAFLMKLNHALSLLSYSNLKLARSLAERDRLMDRLNRAQQIAHLGSWELDLVHNRLTWSDEVYRIFGLQPQEFGATYEAFLEAVHPDDRAAVNRAYSDSLSEGKSSYEITHRVVRKGAGEIRWVHEKCEHQRDETGRIVRSIGMVQDITERKRAEEQMRHAQKLESVGLLAGGIAHDFNNLLVGVIGNASLAEDMVPPASPAREILRRITRCGEQAAHLTRQMLAYAGKGRFVLEPVNLAGMVRDTIPLLQTSISKKITVELELASGTPAIESDPSQMQQVFMNLALNAGEAVGDRDGVISVSTGEVTVDAAQIRDELEGWPIKPGRYTFLEVRDTGGGMDAETKPKIFDPFFSTKFQGRGLGLAAVAGIVRAHNGAVRVTAAPGAGSTFRVLLPVMVPHAAAAAAALPPAIESDLRGHGTVLIVDDEPVVRDLARQSLERLGYEVLVAENGPEAIERLRSDANRIRLVVLDLSMPGMSGQETLPHLRQLKPDLEILVSSGYSEAETLRLFEGARVSGFIQKPYTIQELAREIKAVLDRVMHADK
jgi:PAS domain S-box-containing protein